jgi:hypothetical protein
MKLTALWTPFFFLGLLVACARFGEARPGSAASGLAQRVIMVHKIKVSIASRDVRLSGRERVFAGDRIPLPRTAP